MIASVAEAVRSDVEDAHDGGAAAPGPHAAPRDGDHCLEFFLAACACSRSLYLSTSVIGEIIGDRTLGDL